MADKFICTIDSCNKPVLNKSRGWCSMHYQRRQKHGDPLTSRIDRQGPPHCTSEGCEEKTFAKRLCAKHYAAEKGKQKYARNESLRHARHGAINPIDVADAAYIAGLIDADGTVTVSNTRNRSVAAPMVLVVNGNFGLIEWLLKTVGAGCAYRTKTKPTRPDQTEAHWNEVHRFQVTGWKALALLELVRPFLRVKGQQADLVAMLPLRGRDFPREATEDQCRKSAWVRTQIRLLNQRGRKDVFQLPLAV